ncbi:acyl-CoA dehydrogenase family protein [Janibacter sp. YIM B02568]|uniref:acyl-CoA dehydrogenase family protein n=1 Tax=Janibacter endophyticus TaxID=2806261 RepID=UPI001950CBB1|nr:acyl-CoA dehydrogenase family protein [Janibacter endophyticus]MBM6545426.1 acyl-CoA dehydrogenase family protein [Janibacter endophyticus]
MRWELTEEQGEIRDEFVGWLRHVAGAEDIRRWDDEGPAEFAAAFVEAGWSALGVPEGEGGAGGGLLELALLSEAMGAFGVPSSTWLAGAVAQPAIAGRGALLAGMAEGAQVAVAVPAGSAPDQVLRGRERLPSMEGGVLDGGVSLVLGVTHESRLVVPAVQGDAVLLALVEPGASGLELRDRALLDRTRRAADVSFGSTPAEALDVDAPAVLQQCALRAGVLVAADALGVSQRMLDLAVEYSGQREQFGQPIGAFQAMKHAAATILVGVEAARSVVFPAAAAVDQGNDMALAWASAAKAQIGASGIAAADSALTMHGAIGYTWEHDLHRHYKRAKLDATLFGTVEEWNERIAEMLDLVPST